MPIAVLERAVAAPLDYVWQWLADFGALDKLHPPGNLLEFRCEGSQVGARRFARFKPEMQIVGEIIERLELVVPQRVLAYAIVENYPLPMRDYVAVVHFQAAGTTCVIRWEGHYTEAGLPCAQVDQLLRDFYELFLANIERAYALGKPVGVSPYS
jgi:hypothetical protein